MSDTRWSRYGDAELHAWARRLEVEAVIARQESNRLRALGAVEQVVDADWDAAEREAIAAEIRGELERRDDECKWRDPRPSLVEVLFE